MTRSESSGDRNSPENEGTRTPAENPQPAGNPTDVRRVTIELHPNGNILVDSRGVDSGSLERALLTTIAGIQRELTARRVAELLDRPRQQTQIIGAHDLPGVPFRKPRS